MLRARVATAAVLLVILLSALYLLPPFYWQLACFLAVAACGFEWARLAKLSQYASLGYSLASVFFCAIFAETATIHVLFLATIFWLFISPACLYRPSLLAAKYLLLPLGVVIISATGLALIELRGKDASLLLGVLAVVWISDSVAYLAGRLYGRRKLAPSISPGKSWEGAIAAVFAVFLYSVFVSQVFPKALPEWVQSSRYPAAAVTLLALVLCVAGIIGDLIESAMKRNAGVKDSGRLLPGHGGVLDRADALLAALPIAALLYLRP